MAELADDPAVSGADVGTAWDRPGRKIAGLAAARSGAQVFGLVWFVAAARLLTPSDFGLLGSGLALMVVLGGLSDLGTTRSVVRHVASDPATLWPTLARAASVRIVAGIVVGASSCAVLAVAPVDVPLSVVALAALIAVASGANEVGYAALRSVGRVRTEMTLLILERALFTGVACAALALGAGPLVALGTYAATNTLTAVLLAAAAYRQRGDQQRSAGPLLDAEGRRTAAASSLVIVGPRISAVMVVLLATPTDVGSFAVAQKAPEALSLLGIAMLTTALPLMRSRVVDGQADRALRSGVRITGAVLAVLLPVLAVLAVRPFEMLDLLYGAQDRPGARLASVVLSVAAVGWLVRTLGELMLLAEERAAQYARAVVAGTLVTIAVGSVLVPRQGAEGGAWAALGGEVVVLVAVVAAVPGIIGRFALRTVALSAALGVGAGISAAFLGDRGRAVLVAVVVVWSMAGALTAQREMAWLDRESVSA